MAMLSFGGIDVSKDRLDIAVLPDEQCSSVSNDAAGWAELIEQLRSTNSPRRSIPISGWYGRGRAYQTSVPGRRILLPRYQRRRRSLSLG